MYDIAVIGSGVIGGMIARELSRFQLSICILEAQNDVAMGATKANSAIVHAGFDAKVGSMKARMNVRGSQMMQKVCAELGVKYKNNGSLVIGLSDEDKETLKELCVRGEKNGVAGVRLVEGDELFALEPNLSRDVTCALYAPTGGIVCPYELCIASIGNAMDNGADLKCNFRVTSIESNEGTYTIKSESDQIQAKYVINAAGIYADKIASLVGDTSFDIHPRRGEYILLDREVGELVSHTIFRTPSKMGKGILVTPTVDCNLLVGPTSVDMEDKEDKSTYADTLSLVIKQANENISGGVPFGKSITSFCGLRAVGSTGDFIINSPVQRFINVAGIESPGLSSAPAIAEYVVSLIKDMGEELVEKSDFCPIREPKHHFREASIEEKNEIIKKNPAYGRIICRCESISEGEILDAITSNPKATDIDGVKRRTRAGMGRCQGGFCGPYVMELIAKQNNMPFEDVTKCGGASRMVYTRTK